MTEVFELIYSCSYTVILSRILSHAQNGIELEIGGRIGFDRPTDGSTMLICKALRLQDGKMEAAN